MKALAQTAFSCSFVKLTRTVQKAIFLISKRTVQNLTLGTLATFDLASRKLVCTVAKDNFIYLIGDSIQENERGRILADVDRFDFSTITMEKVADLKVPRSDPYGAAAYGTIFITGGVNESGSNIKSREMYQPTINEWLLIVDGQMAPFMLTLQILTSKFKFSFVILMRFQEKK